MHKSADIFDRLYLSKVFFKVLSASLPTDTKAYATCLSVCVCVSVYVCVREREREREKESITQLPDWLDQLDNYHVSLQLKSGSEWAKYTR